MGKSIFTIIFLIVALAVASKIQTFVKNNQPITIPEEPAYVSLPDYNQDYNEATTTETIDTITSSTTESIDTNTQP